MIVLWLVACLADLGDASIGAHAGRCGDCHVAPSEAFDRSRHAVAATSEAFIGLRDRAADQGLEGFCDGCHRPEGGEGLACVTCHGAAGHQRPANGELLMDPTGPVRGPFGVEDAPHASVEGAFLVDPGLCATCHELDGPGAFVESPWRHWRDSAAAVRGERCQDCHMGPTPGVASARPEAPLVAGGEPRPVADHGFVGLQTDPVALLTAGLELLPEAGGVWLVNHAGHALPDGAAFARELWVEGRTDGRWTGEVHPLHPALHDASGAPVWDPLDAVSATSRALPPDGTRWVPLQAQEACVRYRPLAEPLAEGLHLAVPEALTGPCVALETGA